MALINGAGSGIGKSTAKLFARAGARVGLLGLDLEELEATAQRVGSQSCVLQANVSEPAEMESAVSQLIDRFGRLDVVVANAGINGVWASLESLSPEEWNQTIAVNLTGAFLTLKFVCHICARQKATPSSMHRSMVRVVFSNCGATA